MRRKMGEIGGRCVKGRGVEAMFGTIGGVRRRMRRRGEGVHWGLRAEEKSLDPMRIRGSRRLTLSPWGLRT